MAEDDKKDSAIETVRKVQSIMTPMNAQTLAQIRAITTSIQPALRTMEGIRASIETIKSLQKSFIPIFDSIHFRMLSQMSQRAQEMNTPAFKKFIKDWGWLLNKKSVSFGDYCYGVYQKFGDNGFRDRVNRWFYKQKNLDLVLSDIESKFPERYHVIAEGFEYHAKKDYDCSITLLLPHAEGILWDIGMRKKLVKKGYNSKRKYSNRITSKKHNDWDLSELSKELFPEDKFHSILVKEIFCEGSRNKVLHGRNIYNKNKKEISRWKSTLLILTLWRLSDEL